jgi:dCTP deaminase
MSFWNGEKLAEQLPELIKPFRADCIDCAAYTLSIGREVYVSPTDQTVEAQQETVRLLPERGGFTIPPGQFAFLMTEETVHVPNDAIAFISMKARIKFRGLINVSGFHVDPGFTGPLLFSVFNAAPAPVHLRQGDPCFLIWYADLNAESRSVKTGRGPAGIPSDLINAIPGELLSFKGLEKKIKDVEKALNAQMHTTYYKTVAAIVVATVLLVLKEYAFK